MNNVVEAEYTRVSTRPLEVVKNEIISLTHQAQVSAVHYACEIGKRLIEAKEQVGHGRWGDWLKSEVDYSQSTAESFMKIYREYGTDQLSLFSDFSKSQTIGRLDVSKLLLLTAIPADEREAFAEAADAEHVSVRELKKQIDEKTERLTQQRTKLDGMADNVRDLEQKVQQRDGQIEALKKELAALTDQDGGDDGMEELRAAEAERIRAEYEKKLEALEDKNKKDLEKMAKAESNLNQKLAEAKEEAEAARHRLEETERAVKKAGLSGNADIVLINEYVKRLQAEALSCKQLLKNLKTHENYEKLREAVQQILQGVLENL